LARLEGERAVRAYGDRRDVGPAELVFDDLGGPPRREFGGVLVGGVDHHRGDGRVGGPPRLLRLGGPHVAGELTQRGQQCAPHGVVVLAGDAELAVVAAQPGQEGRERVRAVEAPDDLA
jgi:hypothetical protein